MGSEKSSRSEMTLSEGGAGSGLDFPHHSHSASVIVGLADKKSDSMSDSTSEKDGARTLSTSRHSRERSFERSLENILDRCSEKSLDLNLSVDSWNGAMSEGGSRSLDQMPLSAAKGSKGDKKKKAAWYTVSRLSIFTFCIASGQCIVSEFKTVCEQVMGQSMIFSALNAQSTHTNMHTHGTPSHACTHTHTPHMHIPWGGGAGMVRCSRFLLLSITPSNSGFFTEFVLFIPSKRKCSRRHMT